MEILIHGYSHDTTLVEEPIKKHEAIQLMKNQQSKLEEIDNYIGFSVDSNPIIIQFERNTPHDWILDIPNSNSDLKKVYQALISTRKAIDIVDQIFDETTKLSSIWKLQDYEALINFMKRSYNIEFQLQAIK